MNRHPAPGSNASRVSCVVWAAAPVLACLCPDGALAGSIFMKNGYIIQGPIVERTEASVVLGWSNGKVVIHRRFIDSIALDQTEEKRLAEDAQFQQASEEGGPFLLDAPPESDVVDALPADLDHLMQTLVIDTARSPPPGGEASGRATTPAGDGAPLADGAPDPGATTAAVVPPPEDPLGERLKDERSGVSIRPPKGWTAAPSEIAYVLRGPALPEGFQPSLNVVSGPRGGLDTTDYSSFLKDEMGKLLDGFELVNEGSLEIQGHKAFQAVGRGAHQGRSAWVRQALLVTETDWWLVSAFLPATGADALHSAVEESFKTLELTSR